jgi:hypothetical protein
VRRASFWVAVVLAATALFAGSLYAYVAYRATSGPQGAVRGYFAALQRGDASSALGFGDIPPGPTQLLTGAVLAEQLAIAPMHGVSVGEVSQSGDQASVAFSYLLRFATGDRRYSGTVQVVRRDAGWRLTTTVVDLRISLDQAVDRLNFAGTTAPDGRVLMFPGALPVRFDTRYLQLDPATTSVQFSGPRHLDVRVQPTAAARHLLTTRLRTQLRACTRSGQGSTCPVPSPRTIPGSLRGKLTAVHCTYRVTSEADGAIAITGNAFFVGHYRTLTYDNVAQVHRGRLALPVSAQAFPVAPLSVQFSDDT